jgi:hypothetical protein
VGDDVFVNNETLLVTDFVNLKIKSAQSFEGAHRGRVYVCVHRCIACSCMSIYIYTVFLKKIDKEAPPPSYLNLLLRHLLMLQVVPLKDYYPDESRHLMSFECAYRNRVCVHMFIEVLLIRI